ncbi:MULTISPECIES: endo alpha-1,4 polygalactosaminidase [unclassified Neisseria]|uniref:endo alpha-1,4 polygalactosaminidase n=1 Tax=unclassified Neisseria TaxID=2623750 RepID=UPI002665594D|nr:MULTISPECIES: endo alpha-1,4 polygalactosaminidase [unclassified Neisseria]MDO1509029.1 endo alpha-1,4 polygalactosaminidase [Neisseria sp. MVDL19-042950]MDO1515288.1 endo alpha-1,4 polygalactosaminidase [Neisseria sp. MVDL18-041461]MDO1562648.1 endo alpha-1,4 polygalactosaminidase [Neisseria sp. MVDL20-010259]
MKTVTFPALLLAGIIMLCSAVGESKETYGVFIGMNPADTAQLHRYETVVVDAAGFSAADIACLHSKADKVFSYLNIGSLETFRDYYPRFRPITLGKYENWPDEYWVNVSDKEWQAFTVNTLAKQLVEKGIDGFFIDNADVYFHYLEPDIYQGLKNILGGLRQYRLPVIINGGDAFARQAARKKELQQLATGVNQETVFTSINFATKRFAPQTAANRRYFTQYLQEMKAAGMQVYLLEYGAEGRLKQQIRDYCRANGFKCHIAARLNLDKE